MTITCKNCLHEGVCDNSVLKLTVLEYGECNCFKDKSRYIELPCKVGDTVYHVTEYRGVVEAKVRTLFLGENGTEYIRTTAYDVSFEKVGKTLFVGQGAKEEAEKALAERSRE